MRFAVIAVLALHLGCSAARPSFRLQETASTPPAGEALSTPTSSTTPPCSGWACPYGRTQTLLGVALGSAGVHALDNMLSFRTFEANTVPSTLVQLVYAGGAVAYAFEVGPLFWVVFATAMLTAHSFGHLFVPTATNYLPTFYDHWAHGNNRLGISAPVVGRLSQATLITLDLSMLAVLVSSLDDGFRHGYWLTRKPRD